MKLRLRPIITAVAGHYRARPFIAAAQTVALILVALFVIFERNFWTPDTMFIALLIVFAIFGKVRGFLYRFVPFIGLLLVYDSFRSIADQLNKVVHFWPMIRFDTFVFAGTLPTDWLQRAWWHGQVSWYDFYFYFLYTIHFLVPLLVALLIWWKRDSQYWRYMWGFVILSFAGFVTYVIFPAAPPWMASDFGFIPHIHRISSDIWSAMGVTNFSEVYSHLSPNKVAAVPSLHAAYPMLMALFVARAFGWRRTWWLMFYPISLWIGIVYLGEHYVFDVILGIGYAFGAYYASVRIFDWKENGGYQQLQASPAWRSGFARGQQWRAYFATRARKLVTGEESLA